jgi:hypothetical protein
MNNRNKPLCECGGFVINVLITFGMGIPRLKASSS